MQNDEQPEHKDPVLVSVVTPAYNAMPYIMETVRSVREQDYPTIEHIVMDGGSNDGTVDYLKKQEHLTWVSEPDRGQSHALNKGFRRATGEIIGWLNADDVYQPGTIDKAVEYLLENDDVDLVYGDLQIIDESGDTVGLTRSRSFDLEALLESSFVKQPTVFMRSRLLEKFNGVNEKLHYTMDRELWLRMGMAGARMHYLEGSILAGFRLCPGTKSFEDTPEFRLEWIEVLQGLPSAESRSPAFRRKLRRAQQKTRSQYHVAKMIKALELGDRSAVFSELAQALRRDRTLILNRGTWKFAGMGIFGIKPDRLRKFRKSA